MSMHAQTIVKANVAVDSGIARLVAALNEFPEVQTLDSCQGEAGVFDAYVYLKCADWKTTCEFLFGRLAPAMKDEIDGETLKIEVFGNEDPVGKLTFPTGSIDELTVLIQRMNQRP